MGQFLMRKYGGIHSFMGQFLMRKYGGIQNE